MRSRSFDPVIRFIKRLEERCIAGFLVAMLLIDVLFVIILTIEKIIAVLRS
jgi:hypothetical protein